MYLKSFNYVISSWNSSQVSCKHVESSTMQATVNRSGNAATHTHTVHTHTQHAHTRRKHWNNDNENAAPTTMRQQQLCVAWQRERETERGREGSGGNQGRSSVDHVNSNKIFKKKKRNKKPKKMKSSCANMETKSSVNLRGKTISYRGPSYRERERRLKVLLIAHRASMGLSPPQYTHSHPNPM